MLVLNKAASMADMMVASMVFLKASKKAETTGKMKAAAQVALTGKTMAEKMVVEMAAMWD